MICEEKLERLFARNGGTVTSAEANANGISNVYLYRLAESGRIERVAHGVYISADTMLDKMYVAQLKRTKAIYSHETALFLHDLTDRDPIGYTVTVPTGYNRNLLADDGFTVFSIKKELHLIGVTKTETMFGNKVNVYNLERTICDCLRSRNQLDAAVVVDAIKRYAKRKDKNLHQLTDMAETFKVSKLLRNYMEVLL